MAELASDMEIRKKGMTILFKNLGEVDAVRFLSQIAYEKRDYLKLQDDLFAGMTVENIYKQAKEYAKRAKRIMPGMPGSHKTGADRNGL